VARAWEKASCSHDWAVWGAESTRKTAAKIRRSSCCELDDRAESLICFRTRTQRGLYLNNTEYTQFDFLSPVVTMVEHNASSMHANIVAGRGHTPVLAMLEALTARAGRFARLPEWAAAGGAVVGMQGGSAVVRAKVARLRAKGVPTIAVWLQVLAPPRCMHTRAERDEFVR
jgi:hypothetical protein